MPFSRALICEQPPGLLQEQLSSLLLHSPNCATNWFSAGNHVQGEVTMVIEGAREPESSSGEAAGLSGQEKEFVHDLAAEGVSAKSIARLGSTYQASNKNAFYAYAVQHVAQQRE